MSFESWGVPISLVVTGISLSPAYVPGTVTANTSKWFFPQPGVTSFHAHISIHLHTQGVSWPDFWNTPFVLLSSLWYSGKLWLAQSTHIASSYTGILPGSYWFSLPWPGKSLGSLRILWAHFICFYLTGISILYCLMSSILKTIVLYILPFGEGNYFRREGKQCFIYFVFCILFYI